jgi:ADP-heptose:LPS heptosyltransferase
MDDVKKILIFKLCCFGDAVFITPVIRALKEKYPLSEITYIHSPWIKDIMPYMKHIDKTIEFDAESGKNYINKFYNALKIIFRLRREKFDLVFLGHRTSLFGFILFLSGIKYRFGFKDTKFINYSAPFDEHISEPQRYLKILQKNNVKISGIKTELKRKKEQSDIRKKLGYSENDFIIGVFPFGGINPGTDMDIKRWKLEKYFNLIDEINKEFSKIKILLFEGIMKNELINPEYETDGYVKIKLSIDAISICNIFISGDTGPLHIAAAFDIPTLSIFGPSDPGLVAPVNVEGKEIHRFIWKKPVCSPCYTPSTAIDKKNKKYWNNKNFICFMGNVICLKEITVDEVFNVLKEMLKINGVEKK